MNFDDIVDAIFEAEEEMRANYKRTMTELIARGLIYKPSQLTREQIAFYQAYTPPRVFKRRRRR